MKIKFDFNKIIGYFNLDSEKGLSVNALRDWKVLLVSFATLLLVAFGVDAYSLLKSKGGAEAPPQVSGGGADIKINESALNEVLSELEAREKVFSGSLRSFSPVIPAATTTPR